MLKGAKFLLSRLVLMPLGLDQIIKPLKIEMTINLLSLCAKRFSILDFEQSE